MGQNLCMRLSQSETRTYLKEPIKSPNLDVKVKMTAFVRLWVKLFKETHWGLTPFSIAEKLR